MITRAQETEAKDLTLKFGITIAEALNIVIQIERNEIFKKAFMLSKDDRYPSALESIAMNLGQESR